MPDKAWIVQELTEALKQFPLDAKVYYTMGTSGAARVGIAQHIKVWNEEMGALLDR